MKKILSLLSMLMITVMAFATDHFQELLLIRQVHLLSLHPKIFNHLLILQSVLVIRLCPKLPPFYDIYLLCHSIYP